MFQLRGLRNLGSITILLLLILAPLVSASARRSWTLYHSVLDGKSEPDFTVRGQITLTLKDPSEVEIKKDKKLSILKGKHSDSPFKVELEHKDENVAADFLQQILKEDSFYQLKLVSNDSRSAPSIITTVPACQLRRANFR